MEDSVVIDCKLLSEDNQFDYLPLVEKTYNSSFPKQERREFELVKKLYLQEPAFTISILGKNEKYAGFITSWEFDDFFYIEHFAIDESARNGGIGGKGLSLYLSKLDKPVILEVELPENDLSKRRIGFYERLGFKLDTHPYQQPPYHVGDEWLNLYLMSYGNIDMNREYEKVKDLIYLKVYNCKDR